MPAFSSVARHAQCLNAFMCIQDSYSKRAAHAAGRHLSASWCPGLTRADFISPSNAPCHSVIQGHLGARPVWPAWTARLQS